MNEERGYLTCSNCRLSSTCLPASPATIDRLQLDALVAGRRLVRRKEALFRRGDRFAAVYAIRAGAFKLCMAAEDGREQVSAFQRIGEIVGLDGIAADVHVCDAIALEDSVVCMLPLSRLEQYARHTPAFQRCLHQVMSREIVREQGMMVLLGSPRAAERVAGFLLDLALAEKMSGPNLSECVLHMTRQEIAAHLALTIETVSRTLTRFVAEGVIELSRRHVRVADWDALRRMAGPRTEVGSVC